MILRKSYLYLISPNYLPLKNVITSLELEKDVLLSDWVFSTGVLFTPDC